VERLCILDNRTWGRADVDIENSQWLELFHTFTGVKGFEREIALVLLELVGERVTEVLPALQTLFIEETTLLGIIQESIVNFVAARKLAGYAIAVSHWEWVGGPWFDD
jgi:hypothetical protein